MIAQIIWVVAMLGFGGLLMCEVRRPNCQDWPALSFAAATLLVTAGMAIGHLMRGAS